jgi:hypothetical protein
MKWKASVRKPILAAFRYLQAMQFLKQVFFQTLVIIPVLHVRNFHKIGGLESFSTTLPVVVSLNTKLERTVQQAEVYIPNSRQVSLDTGSNTRLEIILEISHCPKTFIFF